MLVLSRRANEAIQIGNDMTVTVTEVKPGEITLLIESRNEARTSQRRAACREEESIEIAAGIAITLLRIHDEKARLGIQCPHDVPVHRHEVYEAIDQQKGGSYTVAVSLKPVSFLATHQPSGKADMYARFTDRARKVMQLANQEALRFNHEYIGTEHILLGLAKEGAGVGANVLKNLDVNLRMLRIEVEKIVQSGPAPRRIGELPQTPRSKKVIEYSLEESQKLNHNYVGTEHLLLGLLREQEGVAAQVLMNLGLKLEEVREEILNLLGHGLEGDEEDEMEDAEDEEEAAAAAVETEPTRESQESFALSMESHGVLQVAEIEAQALNHGVLSTGHLLLGLTLFSGDPLAGLFQSWKITADRVRGEFGKLPLEYPAYHKSPPPDRTESLDNVCRAAREVAKAMSPLGRWLEQTGRLEREKNQAVADQQFEKAAKLRDQIRQLIDQVHDRTWDVTPAHLLLGLLGAPDSLGVRILENLGLDPEQLHDEVKRRLEDGGK